MDRWTHEFTQRVLPSSRDISGVNMRLTAGSYRTASYPLRAAGRIHRQGSISSWPANCEDGPNRTGEVEETMDIKNQQIHTLKSWLFTPATKADHFGRAAKVGAD